MNDEDQVEILSDGRSVWVNGPKGECLARFGRYGIDVHNSLDAQLEGEGECLQCSHEPTTRADWDAFVKAVATHHGVTISEEHTPRYIRLGPLRA